LLNEVAIWLLVMQKNLQGFGPGLVDLFPANIFVAIAKVQASKRMSFSESPSFTASRK
jgi:hypothetical protein